MRDPDLTTDPVAVGGPIDASGLVGGAIDAPSLVGGSMAEPIRPAQGPACHLALGGVAGQLVERLVWVVDHDDPPLVPRWWAEVGMIVAVSLGGSAVEIMPRVGSGAMTNIDLTAGSGVVRVGRSAYLQAIRSRLIELVDDGVDERFLVRSLRDEVAGFLASDYVAGPGAADEVTALVTRLRLDRVLRARLRDENPYFAGRSDLQLVDDLGCPDDPATRPSLSLIEALSQWAAQDAWATWTDMAVSDEHLDQWLHADRRWRRSGPQLRVIRSDA